MVVHVLFVCYPSAAVTIGFVQTQLTVNESVGSVAVGLELTSGTLQDGVSIDVDITSTDGSARGESLGTCLSSMEDLFRDSSHEVVDVAV